MLRDVAFRVVDAVLGSVLMKTPSMYVPTGADDVQLAGKQRGPADGPAYAIFWRIRRCRNGRREYLALWLIPSKHAPLLRSFSGWHAT